MLAARSLVVAAYGPACPPKRYYRGYWTPSVSRWEPNFPPWISESLKLRYIVAVVTHS